MTITALVAEYTLFGAFTAYGGEFVGQPLACSTWDMPLYYDHKTPRWLALPYGSDFECWDRIYIQGMGMFYALDTGPFGDNCVMQPDGRCLPILADVPVIHADWKLSTTGTMINLSALARECRARGLCD